ncbi:MAG: c-type cytochrome [Chloroflexi bacterium]|nr:c-type cytochrome [Chloroflexota bacterium]
MRFTRMGFAGIFVCAALLAAVFIAAAQEEFDPALMTPTDAERAATAPNPASDDPVERGEYLTRVQMACVGCHGTYIEGEPYAEASPLTSGLAGGRPFAIPDLMTVYASNLTRLGDWTDDQIEDAIRYGLRPDGTGLAPIMGFSLYATMTDQDMSDIIAYLRTLEPVEMDIPEPEFFVPFLSREALGQGWAAMKDAMAAIQMPAMDFSDPAQRGGYLANQASCMHCHGQLNEMFVAAPYPQGLPWGDLVGASLLPFNVGDYTEEELAAVITTGIKNDGGMALGMPWFSYQHMPSEDVQALVAWIRQLPDVKPKDRVMPAAPGGEPAPPSGEPAPETTPGS